MNANYLNTLSKLRVKELSLEQRIYRLEKIYKSYSNYHTYLQYDTFKRFDKKVSEITENNSKFFDELSSKQIIELEKLDDRLQYELLNKIK
tara:strand:- start:84 stop:356 length:273 start_codon:yes stop_codon:yes gene_type:complete